MKRIILWILGGVLVLGVVTLIALTFFLGNIVKAGVNRFGPQLTQTKVELANATISPFSGGGTLRGLKVANPSGWTNELAFSLEQIHLQVAPLSLLGDHIIIHELVVEGPQFDYERRLLESNIGQLLANIEKFSGSTPAAKSGKPVKFEVKKFRLTKAKVSVGVGGVAAATVPMPDLALDDLGTKEGGITPDQLVGVVMRVVSERVVAAGMEAAVKAGASGEAYVKEAAKPAIDAAKKAVGDFQNIFGGNRKE